MIEVMGYSLKLCTTHYPETEGLAERSIQTLKGIISRYCAFGPTCSDSEGLGHDWGTLLPGLEYAYNGTIHSTTGKTPFELERGYIPNCPRMLLNNKLGKMDVHPASASFSHMQARAREHAKQCISEAFAYEKRRWDSSHKEPNIQVGDLVLISTVHFNNLNLNAKLKDPFIGPFPVIGLVGQNAIRVELHGAYKRRHNVFPVSLLKLYKESDKSLFPKRAAIHKKMPAPNEEEAVIHKVLNKRLVGTGKNKKLQYLVTFKNKSTDHDRLVSADEKPNAGRLLRQLRVDEREERQT